MDTSFINDPFEPISTLMDDTLLQQSSAYRNLEISRKIAVFLINDEGVMDLALLDPLIKALEKNLFPLLPNREMDAIFLKHKLCCLKKLKEDKELRSALFKIDRPENHKFCEEMVKRAVGLESKAGLTKAHARQAALSAWLTLLRQNVGSCFATAPALLIQQEKPLFLFQDLSDLFATGRLKRVVGGNEHLVPLSHSFGIGDLRKPLYFVRGNDQNLIEFSKAPGVLAAFGAAGIQEDPLLLLKKTFAEKLIHTPYLAISIEDVFKQILLKHLGVSEKDLEDFEARSRPMVPFGIMEWSNKGKSQPSKSIGDLAATFYLLFDSMKNGFVALTDHPVLKAWEFTLASFCEAQSQFAKWNLYSSLGLDPKEPGGLGAVLYRAISFQVERSNQKMLSTQDEYKTAWLLLQGVESKIKMATSEQELRWIRADYLSKKNEFNTLEEIRDKESMRGQKLANLFQFLLDRLIQSFPRYFQEVYDPDLKEVAPGPYDDAPCGFRLMYKHGRQNTSAWTFVRSYHEFIDSLSSFFNSFEVEYNRDEAVVGIEKEFSQSITELSIYIKTEDFINTAFDRMAKAHHVQPIYEPLKNLDKVQKKPWAYTSGGTMSTLIANYFGLEDKPAEISTWVESPQELLIFLEDAIKKFPYSESERLLEHPHESFLIHSPTHAFRFMPGLHPFNKAWQDRQFTYTFIRDRYILPTKKFYQSIRLDQEMIRDLLQELRKRLNENFTAAFDLSFRLIPRSMAPEEFHSYFMNAVKNDRTLSYAVDVLFPKEEIDALLFANIPYIRRYQIEEKTLEILTPFSSVEPKILFQAFETLMPTPPEVLSNKLFFDLLLSVYIQAHQKTTSEDNLRQKILESMQDKELRAPLPLLFADSNWQTDYFGFLVSPATGELEFWRVTPFSTKGAPMSIWKRYLDGSVKHPDWGIYNNKKDYQ